jgi:protein involved in polysaccharide export with SLBB domain
MMRILTLLATVLTVTPAFAQGMGAMGGMGAAGGMGAMARMAGGGLMPPASSLVPQQGDQSGTQINVAAAPTEMLQSNLTTTVPMQQNSPVMPAEEPLDPDQYHMGRGDVVDLNMWGRQSLKTSTTVDPEGRIFLPEIGYVAVADKTLTEARAIVGALVQRYYPKVKFALGLQTPRTFLVHVVENVAKPGVYNATPLLRVAQLLATVGVQGSRRRIEIHRRNGAVLIADLVRYEISGDRAFNPYLEDGDTIRVPAEGPVASIGGAVWRSGRYELTGSKDFGELLALAGGFRTELTHKLPIRLHRRAANDTITEISFPFHGDGEPPMFALKDGDQVMIPAIADLTRSVQLIGALAVVRPAATEPDALARMPYVEGDTVLRLIERAGGLASDADLHKSYIERNGKILPVNLEALLVRRDFSADQRVEIGDSIVVPHKRLSVMIEGSVFAPGVYEFNPSLAANDYIAKAGGVNRQASKSSQYRVVSADGKTQKYKIGLIPSPGDTIVVPERNYSREDTARLWMTAGSVVLGAASVAVAVAAIYAHK